MTRMGMTRGREVESAGAPDPWKSFRGASWRAR